jgi:predicted ATPase
MELPLQMRLGTARIVSQGWSAPGVREALDRARELCRGAESTAQLIPVLRGLYTHYHALAEHRTAYELAEDLYPLAEATQDPASMVIACHALGQSLTEMGRLVEAREILERGLGFHDPERYRTLAYLYGEEHGLSCRLSLGFDLFGLGYPDQALVHFQEATALARLLDHPHVLAYVTYGLSSLHLLRREYQPGLALAEQTIALCDEKGIPFWRATTLVNRGYARSMLGRPDEGIVEAQQGLATYRAIGANVLQTIYLTLLAEAHLVANRAEAGLEIVTEGLAAAEDTTERCMEAELHRLRAELLRLSGRDGEAEESLQQALEVARGQQAKMWGLRAATSLCHLRRDQGRPDEGRSMLADLYGWFTEGFDTPDLQEAKRLLEELVG